MKSAAILLVWCLTCSAAGAVDRYGITQEEHAACDADALMLCSAAVPDVDRTLACMKEKLARLTPGCANVFKAGLKRRHIPL